MPDPSPRPTSKAVDRALGLSPDSVLSREVLALRVDLQMAEDSAAAWQRVADSFRADLRRVAGGVVPPTAQEVAQLRVEIALLGDLADRSMAGALGAEELCRQREQRVARLHEMGHGMAEEESDDV